jgi:hypothetical protein
MWKTCDTQVLHLYPIDEVEGNMAGKMPIVCFTISSEVLLGIEASVL